MLKEIPRIIYDIEGSPIRVVKFSKVFFKYRNEEGYVLHIEKAERVTAVSEFELKEVDGKFYIDREIFMETTVM
ncbi:hypothetical protein SDC9_125207 [bioreactor metagenome]|uniref:Uncharacterized protein n=2 Tax=root TaxID=1 RepID=A0ABS4K856_9CLOT|nr:MULTISPECIES: hypothetical protein [Clostridium]EQB89353.1 hypothetical protein M918_20685 [Clostridium sp. BL8]MBP2023960.1 hypothetical protein [Clostridium punense]